jgi:plasmid maintenance system antidote protein VapI
MADEQVPARRVSFTVTGYLRHGHPVGGWYDMQSEPEGGQPYTIPEFEVDEDSVTDLPPERLTDDDWAEIEGHLASRLGAASADAVLAQAKRSAAMAAMPWETIDARPGETLRARLKQLRMSQVELCRRTGLSTKHVNQVVKGAIGVSADIALLLERETGIPSAAWNRLDAAWRDRQARARAEARPRAGDR